MTDLDFPNGAILISHLEVEEVQFWISVKQDAGLDDWLHEKRKNGWKVRSCKGVHDWNKGAGVQLTLVKELE